MIRSRPEARPCSARALLFAAFAFCQCGDGAVRADEVALRRLLDGDQRVVEALGRADGLAVQGKGREAANIVRREATPIADAGVSQASAEKLRSEWGRQKSQQIRALLADRRGSLDVYVRALESDDLPAVLASLEAQKELESRGLSLVHALDVAPEGAGCR